MDKKKNKNVKEYDNKEFESCDLKIILFSCKQMQLYLKCIWCIKKDSIIES